jgi:hypothetical protein
MKFFETSAKDGTNVKDAFSALARDVVESMLAAGLIAGAAGAAGAAAAPDAAGKKEKCSVM